MPLWKQIATVVAAVCVFVAALVFIQHRKPEPWQLELGAQVILGATFLWYVLMQPYVRRWLAAVSIEQWRAIDRESEPPPNNPHVRVLVILLVTAVSLTLQDYFGAAGA